MSFEQWYHEVQCIKYHYPDAVVQESIIQSLKGAVADMTRYMGLAIIIAHILQNFLFFGTVASFDVLMQNFYKVTQGNTEKVPPLPQGWKGSSIKSSFSASEG